MLMACVKGGRHRIGLASRASADWMNVAREAMATSVDGLVSHPGRIRAVPRGHHRRRLTESWQVGNGTRQQAASGGGRTLRRSLSLEGPTDPDSSTPPGRLVTVAKYLVGAVFVVLVVLGRCRDAPGQVVDALAHEVCEPRGLAQRELATHRPAPLPRERVLAHAHSLGQLGLSDALAAQVRGNLRVEVRELHSPTPFHANETARM